MRLPVWFPAFSGFFLFQQSFHAAHGPPYSIGSSVLDPITAVVTGLPPLGGLTELASQTLRSIVQTLADEFLRRGLDLFL